MLPSGFKYIDVVNDKHNYNDGRRMRNSGGSDRFSKADS